MKKNCENLDIVIENWWVDWWREDKHYFCAVIKVDKKKYYLERELEQT